MDSAANEYDANCEFCRIVRGLEPAQLVYESELALAITPLEPASRGHTLVIPKHHVPSYWEATQRDVEATLEVAKIVANAIRICLRPDGLNVLTSAGRVASQTVFHLHWHVLPRYRDDALGEFWPGHSPIDEEERRNITSLLRETSRSLP